MKHKEKGPASFEGGGEAKIQSNDSTTRIIALTDRKRKHQLCQRCGRRYTPPDACSYCVKQDRILRNTLENWRLLREVGYEL